MTREELLTAAREAKAWRRDVAGEGDWPWLTEDELANDYGLPEPDALFISLASPDTILEMQAEIDDCARRKEATMPDVTVSEARAARDACEQAIKAAVALFIRQTGLEVASVDLMRLESSTGEPAAPIVTLTVELP